MAVLRVVLALALVAAPFATAQKATGAASSFPDITSGISTLVGASFDSRAAQATQTGLGTTLAGLQSGISAIPAASSSAAAADGSAATAASASAAGATGFQGLFSALGSQYGTVIKPKATLPAGLAATIQGWTVPQVDVGSISLNPTSFDLSALYATLHPKNFPYCTPASFTAAALNPAVVIAPSTSVTIDTGSCAINDDDTITCQPPKMSYQKVPFTYTSPFYTAATYTDAQCIIAKNLTEASTELLYSGGADVTFPTVDAWLATFQTPSAPSLGLSAAGFIPTSPLTTVPITVPVIGTPPPAAAAASATAAANTTSSGTGATAGRRLRAWA